MPIKNALRFSTALFVAVLCACSEKTAQEPEADTTSLAPTDLTLRATAQGNVSGFVQINGSLAWEGIPYAKPPVGELRWKLPAPVDAWAGTFAATNPVPPCPQFVSVLSAGIADDDGDGIVGSEDCLYLSVYAPSHAKPGASLPVMYWIFGGGNNSGYSSDYNGAFLAEQQNVIVVAVNYRLGSLGWFIHPAILDEGANGAAAGGNWSTVDTIAGLTWVQQNISEFGGDVNNVTIFGESAGGGNVMSLVASPMAKGLFHKAIVESGGTGTTSLAQGINFSDDDDKGHFNSGKEIVNKILIRDGKATDRAAAKALQLSMSNAEIKQLLYSQDAASFLQLFNPEKARNYPAPKKFMDGAVFTNEPAMEQLANGNHNHVPIILGTNRDERRIYLYREPQWAELIKNDPAEYVRVAKYQSDVWKLRGVDDIARAMAKSQQQPVFAYRFDWDEQATYNGTDLSIAIGAAHATEMAFVFGDWTLGFVPGEILYNPETNPGRDALSTSIMSYWANFAYTGNPGKGRDGNEAEWQAWQSETGKPKMIVLDSAADGGIRMSDFEVTGESIKAEFMTDSFSDVKNRCAAYAAAFIGTALFDREEYAKLSPAGC